jgi:hypothetical protein
MGHPDLMNPPSTSKLEHLRHRATCEMALDQRNDLPKYACKHVGQTVPEDVKPSMPWSYIQDGAWPRKQFSPSMRKSTWGKQCQSLSNDLRHRATCKMALDQRNNLPKYACKHVGQTKLCQRMSSHPRHRAICKMALDQGNNLPKYAYKHVWQALLKDVELCKTKTS